MNAQQVWMAQATQAPRISLEYIRHQASNLERGTRRRAALNYIASVIRLRIWVGAAWTAFFRRGRCCWRRCAWYGLFMVYSMYRLHRYVAAQINMADAGVLDTLRFHRRQLERQRDFRREAGAGSFRRSCRDRSAGRGDDRVFGAAEGD